MGMEGKLKGSSIDELKKSMKFLVPILITIFLFSGIFIFSFSAKGMYSKTIQTENTPPEASFTYSPSNITTFEVIHFTDNSTDIDGDIISWRWDFDDGTTSNNPNPTHRYEDDGIYEIELTVKDESKATDTFTKNITVFNQEPKVDFTINNENSLTKKLVNFTFESEDIDGTIESVQWDFGDGNESYIRNTSHTYAEEGTYDVSLQVEDDDNSRSNKTKQVTIRNRKPSVDFSFDPHHPYTGEKINFTSSYSDSDGEVISFIWRFSEGGESYEENTTHTFTESGSHFVTLEILDDDNESASVTKRIEVKNRRPVCDLSFTPKTPSTADSVNFKDLSFDDDGQIVEWEWNFGDGNKSEQKNPTHKYGDDGTYDISLTVKDDDGEYNRTYMEIKVQNQIPKADFNHSPSDPKTQDVITFKDISKDDDGEISSRSWDFGDGYTSSNPEPTHRYSEDGIYTVVLTVIDDDESSDSYSRNITVKNTPPESKFTFSPTLPNSGDLIEFEDRSIDHDGKLSKYSWDFGDGSGSNEKNPTHRYKKTGKYDVVLTVKDDDGETSTSSKVIEVVNEKPMADFSITDDTVKTYENIEFFDNSSDSDGKINSWSWDFGDGHSSNKTNPVHSFSDDGVYDVKLIVEDKDGGISKCSKTISVQNRAPIVELSTTPIDPFTEEIIKFDSEAEDMDGKIVTYLWNFGDGNKSFNQNPTHIYTDDGIYNVSLKVTDDDGLSLKKHMKIEVKNSLPKVKFDLSPKEPKTFTNITFADRSTDRDGEIIDIRWDFGDGQNSNLTNPIHSYKQNEIYNVSLTATDDDGGSRTVMKTIRVKNRIPTANFSISNSRYESGDEVQFIDDSDDIDGKIVEWYWDFGDGDNSSLKNPVHKYLNNKTYNVTLKVVDDDGSCSNFSRSITINNRAPMTDFSLNSTEYKTFEVINFTDKSTDLDGEIVNWWWDFGDGNESTHPYPTHFYSDEGTYEINLTVLDNNGRSSSICRKVEIKNRKPIVNFTWNPTVPKKGQNVSFLDRSIDMDGNIEEFSWDFGDGHFSEKRNPTHVYDETGTYSVRLKVSDEDKMSAFLNKTISIGNLCPKIENVKVTPENGTTSSTFNFTLNYRDRNGDEPEFVRVIIDGIKYEMKNSVNSDIDHSNGSKYTYSCKLNKGNHTYYFEASDGKNDVRSPVKGKFNIEDVKKTLNVSITGPEDSKTVNDEKVEIDWEGVDDVSGIDHYNVKIDNSGWIYVKNKTSYSCRLEDGKHTVKVRATNNAGKTSIDQKTFYVNSRIDDLNISILDEDKITQNQKIELKITAQDEYSEVVEMRISDDPDFFQSDTGWVILDNKKDYTLPDEKGEHDIYLKVRTEKGMISRTVQDSIILDKSPPTGSLSLSKNRTNNRTIALNLSAEDNFAEIEEVEVSQNTDFVDSEIFNYTENIQFTIDEQYGNQNVYVRYFTKTDQVSEIYVSEVFYDDEGPILEYCDIPRKITSKHNLTQTIEWNFSDDSGIGQFQIYKGISEDDISLYLNTTESTLNYTITDNRTEILKIVAVDNLGNHHSTIEKTKVDVDYPPIIIPKNIPEDITVGQNSFSIITDDCKDDNVSVSWFIEDKKIGSGNEVTTDLDKGEHIIEVRVTDGEHEISKYYPVSVKKDDDPIISGLPTPLLIIIPLIFIAVVGSGIYYRFFYAKKDGSKTNNSNPKMAVKECLKSSDELTIPEIQDTVNKNSDIDIQKEEVIEICREYVLKEEVSKKPNLEKEDTYRWLNSKR